MKTRIYCVTNGNADARLVEATNQAQAERYVSAPIQASIATQAQLVNLVRSGVEIEKAWTPPTSTAIGNALGSDAE